MEGDAGWIRWLMEWTACGLFVAGAVTDLSHRRIPNAIPLLLLGLFAAYAAVGGIQPSGVLWVHFAIGAVFLGGGFVLYLSDKFGAGDAKLLAVAALWIGPTHLGWYLFGLAAAALALSAFALLPLARARSLRSNLPFAVAIVPPTLGVMIPRMLMNGARWPLL